MKTLSPLAVALAVAALASTHVAQATLIDAKFSGVVSSQIGTAFVTNAPISGEFIFDTATSTYTLFSIGGQSVAAGFASLAALSPDNYMALYQAQLSPVAVGGDVNSTFSVDLEALNAPWAGGSAIALLSSAQLASNLDTTQSSFTYYTANSNGSNLQTVTATLTGIQVSAVPEPASAALWLAGLAVVVGGACRRRTT